MKGEDRMSYYDLSEVELRAMNPDMAILPLGSLEQHGRHLPLNTDTYQIEALAEATARELGAFLLPVQPLTQCYEHRGQAGSFHYTSGVFLRFLAEMGGMLYRQGFRKIVLLCGHGGIFVLEPAVQHLNDAFEDLCCIAVSPHPSRDDPECPLVEKNAVHANEGETSLMLHLHPGLVHMERVVDFFPDKPRAYLNYGAVRTLSPEGIWGTPSLGTAEKGAWMFSSMTENTVRAIRRMFGEFAQTRYDGTRKGAK